VFRDVSSLLHGKLGPDRFGALRVRAAKVAIIEGKVIDYSH
jgi:hypothetical protein